MKKSVVLILMFIFVCSMAGTAMAFPVDFSGMINIATAGWQDRITGSDPDNSDHHDIRTKMRLNFSGQVDQDVTLFGRFANRTTGGLSNMDPDLSVLDQYGVKIADGAWTYSIGRQGVVLGQGSVLGTGNDIGVDPKFDGLVASGKMGNVNTQFAVGKTTASQVYMFYPVTRNVWGLDMSAPLSENLTVGATYASIDKQDTATNATKYLGVNMTFLPSSNLTICSEYVKSSADNNNTAFNISGTYSWANDWFCIQYNRVGAYGLDPDVSLNGAYYYPFCGDHLRNDANAAHPYETEIYPQFTGWCYVYNHQLSKAAAFNIVYESLKTKGLAGSDNEYCTGVTWTF